MSEPIRVDVIYGYSRIVQTCRREGTKIIMGSYRIDYDRDGNETQRNEPSDTSSIECHSEQQAILYGMMCRHDADVRATEEARSRHERAAAAGQLEANLAIQAAVMSAQAGMFQGVVNHIKGEKASQFWAAHIKRQSDIGHAAHAKLLEQPAPMSPEPKQCPLSLWQRLLTAINNWVR